MRLTESWPNSALDRRAEVVSLPPMQLEQDFIKRHIQHLAQLVARALRTQQPEHLEAAQEELDSAYSRLLPMDRQLFELLDPHQIAQQIADPQRLMLIAEVMKAEVELCSSDGRSARGRRLAQRALAMLQEGNCEEPHHAQREALRLYFEKLL